ncbi:GNAT family N-acetyltransferase [Bradyrhizobium murdochi]|uniref:GNAT family N-acetyltransferase n=1 Tax=Bradyrhizobium murdochi TaxID=1038859 RepID=UPI0018DDEC4F
MGLSSAGLLFLDSFFLPREFRGRGLGIKILKEFEDEGRRRGCRSAFLYTISFPDFYARKRMEGPRPNTFRPTRNIPGFYDQELRSILIGLPLQRRLFESLYPLLIIGVRPRGRAPRHRFAT